MAITQTFRPSISLALVLELAGSIEHGFQVGHSVNHLCLVVAQVLEVESGEVQVWGEYEERLGKNHGLFVITLVRLDVGILVGLRMMNPLTEMVLRARLEEVVL